MQRQSGILLPISALPSKYGIGTLGEEARRFADFLYEAGQSVWQILPLGPTGYGDSPYSSFSTYAGNPYYIDLDLLCEDGLLERSEVESICWGDNERYVDYGRIYMGRFELLELAYRRGWERDRAEVMEFEAQNRRWLPDYALYMALKRHYNMLPWTQWENEGARLRKPEVLDALRRELLEDVQQFTYMQYLFFKQWESLRDYVHERGIELIGDLPIYVALDSADVWAEPEAFLLDEKNVPLCVAGVPPDYFSEDGQLWGNPIYDWDAMKRDGYGWWIRRVEGAKRLFDIIRIDHFRGFESYWCVPWGSETARIGEWRRGPGMDLIGVLRGWFHDTRFIAEDLGLMTPEVKQLLKDSGFPGMKILQFAFDPYEPSDYLPHNYDANCVCYIGTHDNETLAQWYEETGEEYREFARRYLGLNDTEGLFWGMLRGGMSSVAQLFVVQMQDCLGLGAESRMNSPGRAEGNWRWRLLPGEASAELAQKLRACAEMYGRAEKLKPDPAEDEPEDAEEAEE